MDLQRKVILKQHNTLPAFHAYDNNRVFFAKVSKEIIDWNNIFKSMCFFMFYIDLANFSVITFSSTLELFLYSSITPLTVRCVEQNTFYSLISSNLFFISHKYFLVSNLSDFQYI